MALFLFPVIEEAAMENESTDPASTTTDEHEHDPEQVDVADRERRELALLVNELEERLADEAGYGHGV
jgi:hypothetical protein